MKIIICIIFDNNNYDNIKLIENTWGNINDKIEYYFFTNNKNLILKNNQIYLYNLDLDNHFVIINWLYLNKYNYDYDFVLFTYYNSYVNINNLIKYLETIDSSKKLYIGGHGDKRIINNIEFHFHSYTPGIILTKSVIPLFNNDNLLQQYNILCYNTNKELINLSGVALGYYSNIYNIELIFNDNFNYCNWKGYPCHIGLKNKNNIICCSNMSNTDIQEFYNYLINKIELYTINKKPMNIFICPGGGLGNILFQYFFGYSLNKKYNCSVYYQIKYNYWRGDINNYKMFKHLNFLEFNAENINDIKIYNEPNTYYNEINFDLNFNYIITGHFQSYKYFIHLIEDIKNELFLQIPQIYNDMLSKYNIIKQNKKTCLIHVRRGDYLYFSSVHPLCDDNYYIKSINEMNKKNNIKYLIFSDDINFINSWNIIKSLDYHIIEETEPEKTIILMSFCDNFIIANSSMSLAAYYLRKEQNAFIIAPTKWFGTVKYKIEDIIMQTNCLIL